MDPSEWFPFSPERLTGDTVYDRKGKAIGEIEATRYDDSNEPATVIVHLSGKVRRDHLVDRERLDVMASAVRVRKDGNAALTLTLDELLADLKVSHAHEGHGSGAPGHTPHGGGPAQNRPY